MAEILLQEAEIDKLASNGNTHEAVKLIVSLIKEYVAMKNFVRAESLRDKIFQIDDMALSEIVETAEIIDKAKTKAIDPGFIDIWSDLKHHFTDEEINAIYYSNEIRTYAPDEFLCRQGEPGNSLFFIMEGQAKSVYTKGREEILLQTIGAGKIAGSDSFFSISVCTTSIAAITTVKAGILTDAAIQTVKEKFPTLLPKLKDYCLSFDRAHELLAEKGLNRRSYERFKIGGALKFFVINDSGKILTNEHRAELSDVSLGGMSFYIRTANSEHARNLLGRKLLMKFGIPTRKGTLGAERTGIITGVISHMFNDYSVHVRFDKLLDTRVEELITV